MQEVDRGSRPDVDGVDAKPGNRDRGPARADGSCALFQVSWQSGMVSEHRQNRLSAQNARTSPDSPVFQITTFRPINCRPDALPELRMLSSTMMGEERSSITVRHPLDDRHQLRN